MKAKLKKLVLLIVALLMFSFCVEFVNGKYTSSNIKNLNLDINAKFYATFDAGEGQISVNNIDAWEAINVSSATKIVELNEKYGELANATRTGYSFDGWDLTASSDYVEVIPGFTQVEYLECTTTQYIDTGIICDENTSVNLKFSFEKNVEGVEIFGASNEGYTNSLELFTKNGRIMYRHNDLYENVNTTNVETAGYGVGSEPIYTLETKPSTPNKTRITNTSTGYVENIEINQNKFTTPYTLTLFALHRSNIYTNETSNSHVRIYSFSLYEEGEEILNLVPAIWAGGNVSSSQNGVIQTRNITKNTAGLVDIKTGVFYINSNTINPANFLTGPKLTSVTENSIVAINNDHTIGAKWLANRYNITLNTNDEVGSTKCKDLKNNSISVLYDSTYNLLPVITRKGYTFKGWFDSSDKEYKNNTTVDITEDTNLYAKWQPNQYTVTFEVEDDATLIGENTKTVYMDQEYGTLPDASRDGYNFLGWKIKEVIEGFTLVDYLECPDDQFIDTGLTVNQNSAINVKFSVKNPAIEGIEIFGASVDGINKSYEMFTKNGKWVVRRDSSGINVNKTGTITAVGYGTGMEPIYTCVTDPINTSNTIVTNTQTGEIEEFNAIPKADFETPTTLYLFALHRSGSVITNKNKAAVRIYSFALYQNGELIMDLVPAVWNGGDVNYSKNGVITYGDPNTVSRNKTPGMYDKENEVFYINSGTGEFISAAHDEENTNFVNENTKMEFVGNHTLVAKWEVTN